MKLLLGLILGLLVGCPQSPTPPSIVLDEPVDGGRVAPGVVRVAGRAPAGTALEVGRRALTVDASGRFALAVPLEDGPQVLTVKVGNQTFHRHLLVGDVLPRGGMSDGAIEVRIGSLALERLRAQMVATLEGTAGLMPVLVDTHTRNLVLDGVSLSIGVDGECLQVGIGAAQGMRWQARSHGVVSDLGERVTVRSKTLEGRVRWCLGWGRPRAKIRVTGFELTTDAEPDLPRRRPALHASLEDWAEDAMAEALEQGVVRRIRSLLPRGALRVELQGLSIDPSEGLVLRWGAAVTQAPPGGSLASQAKPVPPPELDPDQWVVQLDVDLFNQWLSVLPRAADQGFGGGFGVRVPWSVSLPPTVIVVDAQGVRLRVAGLSLPGEQGSPELTARCSLTSYFQLGSTGVGLVLSSGQTTVACPGANPDTVAGLASLGSLVTGTLNSELGPAALAVPAQGASVRGGRALTLWGRTRP